MRIVFAGTPDFAATHLTGLIDAGIDISAVVTQPDKPGKRGKRLIKSAVKDVAEAAGLPVLQPGQVSVSDLEPFAPDLLIVVAYGQILRQDLLDYPTHGCINVHGSLLPRWRGAAPIQRAIEAGDKETGICIMQMDAGLDTGPVLHTASTHIAPEETSGSLALRLTELGINGLRQVLVEIEDGKLNPTPQPEDGTYAKKITKQEAQINWQDGAIHIANKIRAFNPDPICYTTCPSEKGDLRVKLHMATPLDKKHDHKPGTITEVSGSGVTVAAGEGLVLVSRLQLPLGKGSVLTGRDVQNARTDILFPSVRLH